MDFYEEKTIVYIKIDTYLVNYFLCIFYGSGRLKLTSCRHYYNANLWCICTWFISTESTVNGAFQPIFTRGASSFLQWHEMMFNNLSGVWFIYHWYWKKWTLVFFIYLDSIPFLDLVVRSKCMIPYQHRSIIGDKEVKLHVPVGPFFRILAVCSKWFIVQVSN